MAELARRTKIAEFSTLANKTTTVNTYVDVGAWDTFQFLTKHLRLTATTNNLLVQILASLDGGTTYDITAEAEFAVNVGTPVSKTISVFYTNLKVQVKPAVADVHGTLATKIAGAGF